MPRVAAKRAMSAGSIRSAIAGAPANRTSATKFSRSGHPGPRQVTPSALMVSGPKMESTR